MCIKVFQITFGKIKIYGMSLKKIKSRVCMHIGRMPYEMGSRDW
jgi:phosphatidate phosphatase PAH1